MSNCLNPPIGNYWHPKTSGVLCHLVHRCTLGPPACHHCTCLIGCKIRLVSDSEWCELIITSNYLSTIPSWVMQMEPQPMPTLRASTPASMRFFACAAVTTRERQRPRNVLTVESGRWKAAERPWDRSSFYHFRQPPGVQGISAWCSLSCWFGIRNFLGTSPANNIKRTRFIRRWNFLFKVHAVKPTRTTTSTPACTRRSSRYLSSSLVPIAAPHSSCLRESLEARG